MASIYITGIGFTNPLGHQAWQTYRKLLAGKRITDRLEKYMPNIPTGDLVRGIGGESSTPHSNSDPAVTIAEKAFREATFDAQLSPDNLSTFVGTSKGAITQILQNPEHLTTQLGYVLGPCGAFNYDFSVRTKCDIKGHYAAACASSLIALHEARHWLEAQPESTSCAVVTAESALSDNLIASYLRLGVMAKPTPDDYRQNPLSINRGGFVLASCGAAITLQKSATPPAKHYGEVLDTACLAEAYHLILPSPDMPSLQHIASQFQAALNARDLPLAALHPHAPGTANHDPNELQALAHVFGDNSDDTIPCYALKGAMGHPLGAAGLSSLVVALLSAKLKRLPPMPWLKNAAMDCPAGLSISDTMTPIKNGAHACFAAGFGGHVAGVLISP